MSKLEIIISLAVGQIAMVIAMLKRLPQNEKTRKWIVGLKAASAALTEIIGDDDE